jgi:hypothetical protein
MNPILVRGAAVLLPVLALAGCGHSDPDPITLSVSCDSSLLLAGAKSLQLVASAQGTTMSYPDPVNTGHTGTIALQPGHPCTVTPGNGKTS